MMRYCDDTKLFGNNVINDAKGKPSHEMAPSRTAKDRPEHGIGEDDVGRAFELGQEGQAKLDVCDRRIVGRGIINSTSAGATITSLTSTQRGLAREPRRSE